MSNTSNTRSQRLHAEAKRVVERMNVIADDGAEGYPGEFDELSSQYDELRNDTRAALAEEKRHAETTSAVAAMASKIGAGNGVASRAMSADERRTALAPLTEIIGRGGMGGSVQVESRAFLANPSEHGVHSQVIGGDYATLLPRLSQSFAQGTSEHASERVYRVSTTATANTVNEGATKPAAGLALDDIDVTMQKIAALQQVSDEALMDFSVIENVVVSELGKAYIVKENALIATALAAASTTAVTSANVVDGVADSIAALFALGVQPGTVFLNPADYAAARKATASTAGTYVFDPVSAAPNTLHGLTVVQSNNVTSGTAYVGDFKSAGVFFTRMAVRIDVGYDDGDFAANRKTYRVEGRGALGLVRPTHIAKLTIDAG